MHTYRLLQSSLTAMWCRSFESELAETCSPRHMNLGLLPWSASAGGSLSGKYLNSTRPPGARCTVFPGTRIRRCVFVLSNTLVESPPKLLISIIKSNVHRIKASEPGFLFYAPRACADRRVAPHDGMREKVLFK